MGPQIPVVRWRSLLNWWVRCLRVPNCTKRGCARLRGIGRRPCWPRLWSETSAAQTALIRAWRWSSRTSHGRRRHGPIPSTAARRLPWIRQLCPTPAGSSEAQRPRAARFARRQESIEADFERRRVGLVERQFEDLADDGFALLVEGSLGFEDSLVWANVGPVLQVARAPVGKPVWSFTGTAEAAAVPASDWLMSFADRCPRNGPSGFSFSGEIQDGPQMPSSEPDHSLK